MEYQHSRHEHHAFSGYSGHEDLPVGELQAEELILSRLGEQSQQIKW